MNRASSWLCTHALEGSGDPTGCRGLNLRQSRASQVPPAVLGLRPRSAASDPHSVRQGSPGASGCISDSCSRVLRPDKRPSIASRPPLYRGLTPHCSLAQLLPEENWALLQPSGFSLSSRPSCPTPLDPGWRPGLLRAGRWRREVAFTRSHNPTVTPLNTWTSGRQEKVPSELTEDQLHSKRDAEVCSRAASFHASGEEKRHKT